MAPFPMPQLIDLREKYRDMEPKELSQLKPTGRTLFSWFPAFSVGVPRSTSFSVPNVGDTKIGNDKSAHKLQVSLASKTAYSCVTYSH